MQATASTSAAAAGSARTAGSSAPVKPPVVLPGSGNNIVVNPCQRGNPVLECVKNVGKEFGDIPCDYQVGRTTGVLYLSLKYYRLHPEYIHQRIERLGTAYTLRILLILCDVSEHQDSIRELTKICLINNITVVVSWTLEEAGFYLSTFKQFEHKPPTLIKERVDKDYDSMLRTALTSINKVNKTDVQILKTSVGSFADIARASSSQLLQLPGFGQVKVKRIRDAFEKPFRSSATSSLPFQSQSQSQSQKQRQENAHAAPAVADKGKQKAQDVGARRPREPSPEWNFDLDFDSPPASPSPPPQPQNAMEGSQVSRKRPPSPVWDIELDLNESDVEESVTRKRHKGGHDDEIDEEFGSANLLK